MEMETSQVASSSSQLNLETMINDKSQDSPLLKSDFQENAVEKMVDAEVIRKSQDNNYEIVQDDNETDKVRPRTSLSISCMSNNLQRLTLGSIASSNSELIENNLGGLDESKKTHLGGLAESKTTTTTNSMGIQRGKSLSFSSSRSSYTDHEEDEILDSSRRSRLKHASEQILNTLNRNKSESLVAYNTNNSSSSGNITGSQMTDSIDSFFDHYKLVKPLGYGGGDSSVNLAVHKASAQPCAVKIVPRQTVDLYPDLLSEIFILTRLNHPNIISLYDVFVGAGRHHSTSFDDLMSSSMDTFVRKMFPNSAQAIPDDFVYIVMEKGGIELFDIILQKGKLSEPEACYVMSCLSKAISYMHHNLICHRDLKPENILCRLDEEGNICQVKIVDFGLAKLFKAMEPMMSPRVGTVGYKAPEQFDFDGYRHNVDLWSLGVICHILLVGYPPFRSREYQDPGELGKYPFWIYFNDKDQTLVDSIRQGSLDFSHESWLGISEEAKDFIVLCLQTDPNNRLSSREAPCHPWFTKHSHEIETRLEREQMLWKSDPLTAPNPMSSTRIAQSIQPALAALAKSIGKRPTSDSLRSRNILRETYQKDVSPYIQNVQLHYSLNRKRDTLRRIVKNPNPHKYLTRSLTVPGFSSILSSSSPSSSSSPTCPSTSSPSSSFAPSRKSPRLHHRFSLLPP